MQMDMLLHKKVRSIHPIKRYSLMACAQKTEELEDKLTNTWRLDLRLPEEDNHTLETGSGHPGEGDMQK